MAVHQYYLVLLQIIILLLGPIKASEKFLCPTECGNVSIIYPFGIGKGCYFDKGYEVICDNSSGSPKAFLPSIKTELLDSYSDTTIRVNIPVIFLHNSIVTSNNIARRVNVSGSPFTFPWRLNKFTAIGCDNYAIDLGNDSTVSGGCLSVCTCDPTQKSGCYDFLCSIPPISKVLNANLSYFYSQSILQNCRSVSLVQGDWLDSSYLSNPQVLKDRDQVPAMLEWGEKIGTCIEEYSSNPTSCNLNQECLM